MGIKSRGSGVFTTAGVAIRGTLADSLLSPGGGVAPPAREVEGRPRPDMSYGWGIDIVLGVEDLDTGATTGRWSGVNDSQAADVAWPLTGLRNFFARVGR